MARPLEDGSLVTLSYSISWTPPGAGEDGAVVLDSSELRGEPLAFPVGSRPARHHPPAYTPFKRR